MSEAVQRILAALRDHGHEPRKSGAGWSCRCPAHDDRNPSLSIHAGDDGRALVNCHAGCPVDLVCKAIGLRTADLFPDDPSRRNGHGPKTRRRGDETTPKPARGASCVAVATVAKPERTFATAREAVADLEGWHGPRSKTWTYHNAAGDPVGLVIRWDVPADPNDPESKPSKTIQPVSKLAGGWANKGMPTPRPLYALSDLLATLAGSRVFIVEGEKAADAARAVGLVATTSPHGSNSAKQVDWSPLAGRHVVVLPDHDEAGEKYADKVARLVTAAGAKSVRVVRLVDLWAGMPEGGDLVDLLNDRGGDAERVLAEVEALTDNTDASVVTPDAPQLEAVPAFNLDAVIPSRAGYARDYFAALSRSTQTPIEMPTLLGLAIASATVCNVARVRGHGDHIEPAQLWGLVLCEPAVRKSAVLSELLAPIVAWEKREAEELGPAIAAAVQRRKIEEKRLKAIEDDAARCKDANKLDSLTNDAVRLAQAMQAEPIPTPPVLLASEPTPEALARQMVANHGRALLASAEADALDIVQGRYSGARNYGIMLKGHAGDAVRAQRVGRTGDTIDHPALAVALCVQPQAVSELWTDPHAEGRGLLARFAVILPRNRIGYRNVRPPAVPESARARWRAAIDRLLTFKPGESPMIVGLGADADVLYHDFQKRTESALGIGDLAERRAWGGKLCGAVLRIALTLHALETWALSGRPEDFPTINAATMRAAIAWADFLASAERHAREVLGESDEERELRRLAEWIECQGGTTTVRDLTRGPREYRGDPERAAKALGELVAAGVAVWDHDDHGTKGGRPAERVRLVSRRGDTGDGDETPANAGNRGGFVTVATVANATDAGDGWGEL
jgi:putative DNA primase/helicase